ncbi:MAG: hypothetical protein HZB20_00045 [Chloroflexi bacterium]|nr:hypothetical protein [Chloroflexota bacterium]
MAFEGCFRFAVDDAGRGFLADRSRPAVFAGFFPVDNLVIEFAPGRRAFCKGEAFAHHRLIFAAGRSANASPQPRAIK